MGEFYLLTFKNTYDAMSAEKLLKELALKPIVVPTPTTVTKSCGLSIRIENDAYDNIKELIQVNKLVVKEIYVYKDRVFTPES